MYPLACAAVQAADRDSAIAWLQAMQAVPTVHTAARLRQDRCLTPLRGDPRFTPLTSDTIR
jgi:hypothetical protein